MSNFLYLAVICLALLAQCSAFTFSSSRIAAPMRSNNLEMVSHRMGFNRLSRPADQRKALVRSLTTEVIRHGRIRTTLVKAKAIRKYVDHMITLAKRGTLHTRRQAMGFLYDKDLVASLFEQVPERYAERNGGYCRVIREDLPRRGDSAQMAIVELV
jgi:large subunit ribosomal protein L17